MPTHPDSTENPVRLYLCMDDGPMFLFEGIKEVEIVEPDDIEDYSILRSWSPEEMTFTATMTKQSIRAWKKMFRPYDNKMMRMVRTWKRYKEKYRRERLKAGGRG